MSSVNPLDNSLTASSVSSSAVQGSNKLGKDEFLKLLTAQLANQDPLSPTDNQAFIAQLAQFSSVEQQTTMNDRLEQLIVAQASTNQTATANLVGKDIVYKTDHASFDGHTPVALGGTLSADAASVNAIITDANGKTVRTVKSGAATAGTVSLQWDGRDDSGTLLPAGSYTVKLTAADPKGNDIPVQTQGRGRATGISFSNGFAELLIDGVHIKLADVLEINEPKPATSTTTTTSSTIV